MVHKPLVVIAGLPTATQLSDTDIAGTTTGAIPFVSSGFLLEDATNFFWDETNKRLGIGTNAPATAIDCIGGVASTSAGRVQFNDTIGSCIVSRLQNSANPPAMQFVKGRGTSFAAISPVQQNDNLGSFTYIGYVNSSGTTKVGGLFACVVIEPTPSATALGSSLQISLSPLGSISTTETVRFEFDTGISMYGANPVIDKNRVMRLRGYTVATLPAGVVGMFAYVTDALAPTFLGTIVGGGLVTTPVFYNGTNWVGG